MKQQIIIRTHGARIHAISEVDKIVPSMDAPYVVEIKPWKRPRSNPQNRLLWVIHTQVAAHISAFTGKHWTPESVHYRIFVVKFLGGEVVELPDGSKAWASETSSTQDVGALADAMTAYQAWCYEVGIELDMPEEYQVGRGY